MKQAMDTVTTDAHLRRLLRTGRRAAGLSQREAASRAGISEVYWQKIEAGTAPAPPADTLARMAAAAEVTAGKLREGGHHLVADALDELANAAREPVTPEDHLAATPGASPEEIGALQALWQALRAGRAPEPFEQQLRRSRRRPEK